MSLVLPLFFLAAAATAPYDSDAAHTQALAEANAAVQRAVAQAESDPLRPIYHVMAAARFINDPNGPVYFNGEYHVFFQHLPYWGDRQDWTRPVWGHAVSTDFVHWQHLPIALAPTPGSYDADAIASGCCVIDGDTPTIIYTGVGNGRQTQCLATSADKLRTWQKDPANPVIPERPPIEGLGDGFRDPCAWREGNEWRILIGSGFEKGNGAVLLYGSPDLHHWNFLGPLCSGMGEQCFQWECPAFFPLGGKHVLIVSPLYRDAPGLRGKVEYAVGAYQNNRFEPGPWCSVDLGGETVYYAPNSFLDPKGRRILWGWIMAGRPESAGWCHCLSLPRVLTLAPDDTLRYEPAPELAALRTNPHAYQNLALPDGEEVVLEYAPGRHAEIQLECELEKASRIELRIARSDDGNTFIPIVYDAPAGKLTFGDKQADFRLAPGETRLDLRLFLDGCVGELYLNQRACFSNVLPVQENAQGVSLLATGGPARVQNVALYQMQSIWTEAK